MGEGAVAMRDDKVPLLSTQLTPIRWRSSRPSAEEAQICSFSLEHFLITDVYSIRRTSVTVRMACAMPKVCRLDPPTVDIRQILANTVSSQKSLSQAAIQQSNVQRPSLFQYQVLGATTLTPCSFVMRTRSRAKVTKPVRSSTSRRQFLLAQETWEDLVAIDSMDTDAGGRLRVYIKTIDTGEVSAHDAAVTYAKCPQKVCVHAMSGTINSTADTRRCFASTKSTFASYNMIPPTQMHGIGRGP